MYNITNEEYYNNNGTNPTDGNHGSYQYVSLEDLVTNFMVLYVGNDKVFTRVERHDIIFHAKRAIQVFEYDAANCPRVLELTMTDTNAYILPPDYVGFIKISLDKNGILFPMIENKQQISAASYLQDVDGDLIFDVDGYVIETSSALDEARTAGLTQQLYLGSGVNNGNYGWCVGGDWYFSYALGPKFGLEPDLMNINPTYRIDKANGVIYFGSDLTNQHVVLEYVSDGLNGGNDSKVRIHKFAEEYVYNYIKHALSSTRRGFQEYVIRRYKNELSAERANAKLRLGRTKIAELLMTLRNQGKWLK
jgi:hypothetical protein